MLSTLEGIVNAPNHMTSATAVGSLVFAAQLLAATVDADVGISTTGADYVITSLSYILRSTIFNGSEYVTAAGTNNISMALRYLSEAQLYDAPSGVGYTVSSDLVQMKSFRDTVQYFEGTSLTLPQNKAKLTFPSNTSRALRLPASDTLDVRVATFDIDLYSSGFEDLNSAIAQIEVAIDNDVISLQDLPVDDPVMVTLLALQDLNTNISAWTRYGTCFHDDEILSFDCPLGVTNYTCDQTRGGTDGTYFVTTQCPGIVPSCLSWSDTNEARTPITP